MRNTIKLIIKILFLVLSALVITAMRPIPLLQNGDPNPPGDVVKLVFIHHSTGENWLTDGYGGLGHALDQNNYFVSDTNYGWGPNGIGDRTDIPNWMEWFRSEDTPTYMSALLDESGQNSGYTRTLSDPGGQNQVVMFKSCFPNSALGGNPNDPPGTYEEMTVSGAKYTYNQILQSFSTRPDVLFVVITAPPFSDPTYAAKARAFNQWLVDNWLLENNYTQNNVAVFDFYNVLTGQDSHHRFSNGQIEHTMGGSNTLHYPSGDDHPSEQGSQKATEEFIPLLNVFYNRWRGDAPSQPPGPEPPPSISNDDETQPIAPPESDEETQPPAPPMASDMIDNFDDGPPAESSGWEPYSGGDSSTTMDCAADSQSAYSGSAALKLDFDIPPDSWGTCALIYNNAQNWSSSDGITFFTHAAQSESMLDVLLYVDVPDGQEAYVYTLATSPESEGAWERIDLSWDQFRRVDWEADAGTPFAKPDQVSGIAFGFSTEPDKSNIGTIWVDDLQLLGSPPAVEQPEPPTLAPESSSEPTEAPLSEPTSRGLPCLGALILPFGLVGMVLRNKRKQI